LRDYLHIGKSLKRALEKELSIDKVATSLSHLAQVSTKIGLKLTINDIIQTDPMSTTPLYRISKKEVLEKIKDYLKNNKDLELEKILIWLTMLNSLIELHENDKLDKKNKVEYCNFILKIVNESNISSITKKNVVLHITGIKKLLDNGLLKISHFTTNIVELFFSCCRRKIMKMSLYYYYKIRDNSILLFLIRYNNNIKFNTIPNCTSCYNTKQKINIDLNITKKKFKKENKKNPDRTNLNEISQSESKIIKRDCYLKDFSLEEKILIDQILFTYSQQKSFSFREINKYKTLLLFCPFSCCQSLRPFRYEKKFLDHLQVNHKNNFNDTSQIANVISVIKKLSQQKIEKKENIFVSLKEINSQLKNSEISENNEIQKIIDYSNEKKFKSNSFYLFFDTEYYNLNSEKKIIQIGGYEMITKNKINIYFKTNPNQLPYYVKKLFNDEDKLKMLHGNDIDEGIDLFIKFINQYEFQNFYFLACNGKACDYSLINGIKKIKDLINEKKIKLIDIYSITSRFKVENVLKLYEIERTHIHNALEDAIDEYEILKVFFKKLNLTKEKNYKEENFINDLNKFLEIMDKKVLNDFKKKTIQKIYSLLKIEENQIKNTLLNNLLEITKK
jgi:hypothetical protein